MARVAFVLFVVLAVLLLLRVLRVAAAAFLGRPGRPRGEGGAVEGEMVRDPVCGTWIDRRLALAGRKGVEWVPVCSEKCRGELEAAR